MSTGEAVESAIERSVRATPIRHVIDPGRATRFFEFAAVGSIGAVLDILTTFALLGSSHYLAANALGFLVAVSFNFAGNWSITFGKPKGSIPWQYGSYVGLHATTFAIRAAVIAALVEITPTSVTIATIAGVGTAAVANFLGSETIFDGDGELWFDVVDATNTTAHIIYGSRLRAGLRIIGLYGPLYRVYQLGLGVLYRADVHDLTAAGASATVHTEHPAEIVSIMHTREKESDILERFIGELQPDDVVWDVGANLGVFSVLAGDVVEKGSVVAFEPVPKTADRCRQNFDLSDINGTVQTVALADTAGTAALVVERDEVGTQTPSLGDGAGTSIRVDKRPGDQVTEAPAPTVLKIDVEGTEVAVLDGLEETLDEDSLRLVYVETHDGTFHDGDSDAVRSRLAEHGFDIDVIDAGSQAYYRGVQS